MRELGHRFGEGAPGEPVTESNEAGRAIADAVLRAELRRSRQAVFGTEVHPQAALFASRLARAVADAPSPVHGEGAPGGEGHGAPRVLPPLRDAVLGGAPVAPVRPEAVALPAAPALVCDRAERVVRVNAGLVRLAGRDDATLGGLFGVRLAQLVVGPDADARLVRPDGSLVRVGVVRLPLPADGLTVVALVKLDAGPTAADPRWTAELERLARVGTWTFELATSTLHRSDTLDELYRSVGVDPDGGGSVPVEREQVALLCRGLRSGARTGDHHVEVQLPGDRILSCRAEVQCGEDGTPERLVGVVHDISAERVAQRRVERSGQRFADLMGLMPGGVALLDSTGRVVDANAGLCRLLDVPLERLRGAVATALSADVLLDPPDPVGAGGLGGATKLPSWLRPVPPGARHGYRVEAAPLQRGDGTIVWCELAVSATSSDAGGWFWLVVCTDISERRRAAELLRSAAMVDDLTRLRTARPASNWWTVCSPGRAPTASRWCAATSTTSPG